MKFRIMPARRVSQSERGRRGESPVRVLSVRVLPALVLQALVFQALVLPALVLAGRVSSEQTLPASVMPVFSCTDRS